jgi:transcriptional regulator with XRE-family HTH domain
MKSYLSGIEHIGARLRMVRKEKGLTQDQLAARVGTGQDVIQKIENGCSLRPRCLMEVASALDINPAWLQFGEPYANKEWPSEIPRETKFTDTPNFTTWLKLADQLIESATKDQLAETARLQALNLAHYKLRFGEIPLENFAQLMETQEIDSKTARLVVTGMENLVGVFGLVAAQDEAANNPTH